MQTPAPVLLAILIGAALTASCGGGTPMPAVPATASAAASGSAATATSLAHASGAVPALTAPARAGATAAPPPGLLALMPLGDSITFGANGSNSQGDGANAGGGFRSALWADLHADGLDVDFVGSQADGPGSLPDKDHEGHSGWKIVDIAGSTDTWMDSYRPDVVTLMIGTNDMVFDTDVANAPTRLRQLIEQITTRLPHTRLLVATITPLGDAAAGARVQAYNAAVPGVVQAEAAAGRPVSLVRMGGNFSTADLYDGIHPNPAAYARMAVVWHNATLPVLRRGAARLPLNTTKSFQATTPGVTDHFLDASGVTSVVDAASALAARQATTFNIVAGLAGAGCYSLQSAADATRYLRHAADASVHADTADGSDAFRQDATWCSRPGANGQGVTLEAYNGAGQYLRHADSHLWLASGTDLGSVDGSGPFTDDISWSVVEPLVPNTATGGSAEARDTAAITLLRSRFDPQSKATASTQAPTLDAIINHYERTHDAQDLGQIKKSFKAHRSGQAAAPPTTDYAALGWFANTWLRAYDVTGDKAYLDEARGLFKAMRAGWDTTCGGGLWASADKRAKDAISNELFLLAAARLARRADGSDAAAGYPDWAAREWTWFSGSGLLTAQNLVGESLDAHCAKSVQTFWTREQGLLLGGLAELWRLDGDRGHLFSAELVAEATLAKLASPAGVLREACETTSAGCTGDAPLYKGLFAQGLARLYDAERDNKPQYGTALNTNADSLWDKDRNAKNAFGLKWTGPFDAKSPLTQAAAALLLGEVALLNAGGEATQPLPANATPVKFAADFDTPATQPTWSDTVDYQAYVGGYCCTLTHMETSTRSEGFSHSGATALVYSGNDNDATRSFSYNKVFDVNVAVGATTTLSYWIYPLGAAANSAYAAVDLVFTDGSTLRDSGAVDQNGIRVHPAFQGQGGKLVPDQWNLVSSTIGAWAAGKTIDSILVGYDRPDATGNFRGFIDDIQINAK